MLRFATLAVSFAVLAGSLEAQSLQQSILGGSVPGTLEMRAGPSIPIGAFGVVFVSLQQTSIPLAVLDPADPRSLGVGLELGAVSQFGLATGAGTFDAVPLAIPNDPSFIDGALVFQSTFIPGLTYFIGELSRVEVVRFGPAGQFRDRGTFMSGARAFFPSIKLSDGRVMFPGGGSGALLAQLPTNVVDVYDERTDALTANPFTMIESRSLHTATELFDGRVFIVGGVDAANDPVASTEFFDPVTGTFTPGPNMAIARMAHTATALRDGRVLIAGGIADMNQPNSQLDPIYTSQATTEIFNPFTNQIVPGPNMSAERTAHGAIGLPDGRVLLAGGVGYEPVIFIGNLPRIEDTSDVFDPVTNQITAGPRLSSKRATFTLADLGGGRFLASGGIDDLDLINQGTPTNSAEIYDVSTNRWTPTGSMAAARGLHSVHPIGGGRFLHIGGADGSVLAPVSLASTEIYDANTGTFSPGPALPQPLSAHGSYVDAHGQIHILGGANNGVPAVTQQTLWYYP